MRAALVEDFARPPRYGDFERPEPQAGEVQVQVQAAALSQLVRGQAAGRHYSAGAALPFVPGADGVGTLESGERVYFAFPRAPFGSMAEHSVVRRAWTTPVPDGLDSVTAAAIANPGMSSWVALTERAQFQPGESVLVNGATGVSGRLALQIARHLGARRVVATSRSEVSGAGLGALGADRVIALDQPPEALVAAFRQEFQAGVGVVLDYLWGTPAEQLIAALMGRGSGEAEPRVRFVQVGSLAGLNLSLPAAALRSSGLELLGSGLGSSSHTALLARIGELLAAVGPGGLAVDARAVPLREVERAWSAGAGGRVVFTAP